MKFGCQLFFVDKHVVLWFERLEDLNKLKSAITKYLEKLNYGEEKENSDPNTTLKSNKSIKTPPVSLDSQTVESMSSEEEELCSLDLKVFLHPHYFKRFLMESGWSKMRMRSYILGNLDRESKFLTVRRFGSYLIADSLKSVIVNKIFQELQGQEFSSPFDLHQEVEPRLINLLIDVLLGQNPKLRALITQFSEGLNLKHWFANDYLLYSDLLYLMYVDLKFPSLEFEYEDFNLFEAFSYEMYLNHYENDDAVKSALEF